MLMMMEGMERARGKLEALFGQERHFMRSLRNRIPTIVLQPSPNPQTRSQEQEQEQEVVYYACDSGLGSASSPRRHKLTLSHHHAEQIFHRQQRHRKQQKHDCECGCEEAWKFQTDLLRAECQVLRMEKNAAISRMRHALRLARSLHALLAGRNKILDDKNAEVVLQTTLQKHMEMLQQQQQRRRKSSHGGGSSSKQMQLEMEMEMEMESQVLLLQRTLKQLSISAKKGRSQRAAKSLQHRLHMLLATRHHLLHLEQGHHSQDEEQLLLTYFAMNQEKPQPLSKSRRNTDLTDDGPPRGRRGHRSLSLDLESGKETTASVCSNSTAKSTQSAPPEGECVRCPGRCTATIRKIAEQFQAETEQWSQMQEILYHVKEEMELLQKSRDLWEEQALEAHEKITTLEAAVHEWRQKARSSEKKVAELLQETTHLNDSVYQTQLLHDWEQQCTVHLPLDKEASVTQETLSTKYKQVAEPRASKSTQTSSAAVSKKSRPHQQWSKKEVQLECLKENASKIKQQQQPRPAFSSPFADIGNIRHNINPSL